VVVAGEGDVYAVADEQRLEILPNLLVGAMPRRAIEGSVQEGELPTLVRGLEIPSAYSPPPLRQEIR
jgi:hypothetical protein